MRPRPCLFAKKATEFSDLSGGAGPENAPGAPAAPGAYLPLDDPSLRSGTFVRIQLRGVAEPVTGFRDPVYGWMDQRGVIFPATSVPEGWQPLP